MTLCRPSVLYVWDSETKPSARIVSETGCGASYPGHSPLEVARVFETMMYPDRRRSMADRGLETCHALYNWHVDSARLIGAVRSTIYDRSDGGHRRGRLLLDTSPPTVDL